MSCDVDFVRTTKSVGGGDSYLEDYESHEIVHACKY